MLADISGILSFKQHTAFSDGLANSPLAARTSPGPTRHPVILEGFTLFL